VPHGGVERNGKDGGEVADIRAKSDENKRTKLVGQGGKKLKKFGPGQCESQVFHRRQKITARNANEQTRYHKRKKERRGVKRQR